MNDETGRPRAVPQKVAKRRAKSKWQLTRVSSAWRRAVRSTRGRA